MDWRIVILLTVFITGLAFLNYYIEDEVNKKETVVGNKTGEGSSINFSWEKSQ